MQGGVGPHQQVPASPVDVDLDLVTLGRELAVGRFELVANLPADFACRLDGPGPAIGGPQQRASIGRLAAAARIEDGPVEDQERLVTCLDAADARADRGRVSVAVAQLLAR